MVVDEEEGAAPTTASKQPPEEIVDITEAPDDEVSLYTMYDVSHPVTIRLGVTLHDDAVVALVDIGSTHNFVCSEAACRLLLKTTPIPPFQVKVANGETLACTR
ncbi:unnamed protein product [Linum trigynum]|uniref:Gag-pol polyprotein n=1 Tax=Linum trigynum TaxID=586398 RepID=A0AAV2CF75_9ROSI